MTGLEKVETDRAPAAIGPYSQAIVHDRTVFCSGAVPVDPATGKLIEGSIADEADRCLANLQAVCEAAGTSLDRAVQLTVYTTELERFADINAAYAAFFEGRSLPARVTVGVAALPLGSRVEIAAIVAI